MTRRTLRRVCTFSSVRTALPHGVKRVVHGAVFLLAMLPGIITAQSAGDLAAWNALVLSPVGAFAPRLSQDQLVDPAHTDMSFRYGRWQYDLDDAIHNDMGLTIGRQLGATHTGVSATLAYLSVSCGSCAAWVSGGVEVQRALFATSRAPDSAAGLHAGVGLRASAGAARYMGTGGAIASSIAGAATLDLAVPAIWSTQVMISLVPGIGFGRFSSPDETASGVRPMLGGALGWVLGRGVIIGLGVQRIIIDGGPTQAGGSLSWRIP